LGRASNSTWKKSFSSETDQVDEGQIFEKRAAKRIPEGTRQAGKEWRNRCLAVAGRACDDYITAGRQEIIQKKSTPGGDRTPDLLVRSQALCPAELRAHKENAKIVPPE
jgi:hypothetical protein